MTIKVAINGYGNLGRAVERAVNAAEDMQAVAVFTRRDPKDLETAGTPAYSVSQMPDFSGKVDVCICCGGSATDLRTQGPAAAKYFNTVDSFDTHADIPAYFADMDTAAKKAGHSALISTGWDPGLFSIARTLTEAVLPNGYTQTFWGRGVSQGHSDAIRRIEGVEGAVQYTVPNPEAMRAVESGDNPQLTTADKHTRLCFVVAAPGADKERITREIKQMPKYFADYETTVNFISAEELAHDHAGMPHGGEVIRVGHTREGIKHLARFQLQLDSNPDFTGSMVAASARALVRLHEHGHRGAASVLDLPPAWFSPSSPEQLRAQLL